MVLGRLLKRQLSTLQFATPLVMTPLECLALLLKPAGAGVYLVSTGKAEQLSLQQRLYQVDSPKAVQEAFKRKLEQIESARGFVLGIPSDVGAGFRRGANLGPQAIRTALLAESTDWNAECRALGLVDLGDVFVVPQLLDDEMLSEAQLERSRRALYPEHAQSDLPVSPLSIAERAMNAVFTLNPTIKPFILGGDHSVSWPVVVSLHRARVLLGAKPWGIVQSDAHTDLLEERLGVRHCFATWSFHANALIGRQGRMTQVGIRASGKDKAHWEQSTQVKQFWAADVLKDPQRAMDDVVAHVKASGVDGVYFSNDIDGTDAQFASATGTPEPDGLTPQWLMQLIERLGQDVGVLGGDVTEVAPSLGPTSADTQHTVSLAARYFKATVRAALGQPS
jgi:arginase family enzyme